MNLLVKHKKDYKSLNKKDLILIIEDQLKRNKSRSKKENYNAINSIRNNNRRSLRKYLSIRHNKNFKDTKIKILEKIKILRGIS